jgi:hypothetical protein
MAELEIHHEGHEGNDPLGRTIGVVASVLAVLLAVVTILSHRSHTDAVLKKADENDKWSFYQSKKIKFHNLELGEDLISALPARAPEAEKMLARYASEKARYSKDAEKAQGEAEQLEKDVTHAEDKALRYDFGEGLLEIGLVLTSLYFISRSKLFPVVGIISAAVGTVLAILGWFA